MPPFTARALALLALAHASEPPALRPPPPAPIRLLHGTTTLAFRYRDGVVVAVDSRASMGSYIGSRTTRKILPIGRELLGTMAGGAADCAFWIRHVSAEVKKLELEDGATVGAARASRILADALVRYRGRGLSVGTMIVGPDDDFEDDDFDDDVDDGIAALPRRPAIW